MTNATVLTVHPGTGEVDPFECPFCGTEGIKFGMTVCRGCQAKIEYTDIEQHSARSNTAIVFLALILSFVVGFKVAGAIFNFPLLALGIGALCGWGAMRGTEKILNRATELEDWSAKPVIVRFSRGGQSMVLTGMSVPLDL